MDLLKKEYEGREWYHQRFDGSPLFIYAIADADLKQEKRKPAGTESDVGICFFEDGQADWYLDMKDVRRAVDALMQELYEDPDFSQNLMARWKDDEKAFADFFFKEFPTIDLKALNDDELVSLWKRYWSLFHLRTTSTAIIDHFSLGTDVLVADMVRDELGETKRESEFTAIFSTATAPTHLSFINLAEIDLLRIITGRSNDTLEQYREKYYWTMNNYVRAHVRTIEEIKEDVASWKGSGKDLEGVLDELTETPKRNQKAKEELFSKHEFSAHLQALLKMSEDFTWWQDERKKATYLNIDMGQKLLAEISDRIDYNADDIKYANETEIASLILEQKPSLQVLKERRSMSAFVWTREGYSVLVGDEARELREHLLGGETHDEVDDIRGLSASTGKAKGVVRVVNSSTEINKVNDGDILVAVMTRPDYVPAMKKAAAIVTDEGGITSHAAIVSRELGIPCIIGTKVATSVFKDGDLVQVNANHGWVRKVQK